MGSRRVVSGGCRGWGWILILILLAVALTIFSNLNGITKWTYAREKLPNSYAVIDGFYEDDANWISRESELTKGMKSFYRNTGVAPFVYITDGSKGTSSDELSEFTQNYYDKHFTDEAHFILAIYDDGHGSYTCGYTCGSEANTVMDEEAVSILADYLDRYYNSDVSDEEFLSKSFEKTGIRIMSKTPSAAVIFSVFVGIAVILIILFVWWKKVQQRKKEKAAETERILNTPIEKI